MVIVVDALHTTLVLVHVAGIGGLKNEAKRNVKPDQLRPVARDKCI